MTLIDFDHQNHDLSHPMPRTHDVLPHDTVMARGTNSINYITPATSSGEQTGDSSSTAGGGTSIKHGFKRLVATVPVTMTNDGSTLTTSYVRHNLGYVPMIEASIENATSTIAGGTAFGLSLPLPTWLGLHTDTGAGFVYMHDWMEAFANDQYMYINYYNATGNPVTITVTCYLYQRQGD